MPRVMQSSKQGFHLDPQADVVLHFSFDCEAVTEGGGALAYTRVQSNKFAKHVQWLDVDSIPVQGRRHTAIQPTGLSAMRPLYEEFSRDLVREFFKQGGDPIWIELKYDQQEFRGNLVAVDVARQADFAYRHLVVGASVYKLAASRVRQSPLRDPQTGVVTVVHINHGPYAC